MMNESAVGVRSCIGGFHAMFKLVWKADFQTVMERGKPAVFPTEDAAKCAAYRVMRTIEEPVMFAQREERVKGARAAAEAVFGGKKRRKRRGRG